MFVPTNCFAQAFFDTIRRRLLRSPGAANHVLNSGCDTSLYVRSINHALRSAAAAGQAFERLRRVHSTGMMLDFIALISYRRLYLFTYFENGL